MDEPWKEILIDVEPRGKEFRLGIDEDATANDIIQILIERCDDEGIDLKKWAKMQVGNEYQFVLLRKAEGNSILPPGMLLEDIEPEIQTGERFKLSTQAVVGALPVSILNRRVESLIDEFYSSSLADIYEKEGWSLATPQKKKECWEHPDFAINIYDKHPDGAYKTIRFTTFHLPGLLDVKEGDKLEIGYNHIFLIRLPREYPQLLGKVEIYPDTPLYHPRIRAVGTKACYMVNGEIDRVFNDIIYNILLRPETVRPPSMYKDADWGLDSYKMKWYIKYGPQKIYDLLKSEWQKQHESIKPSTPKPKRKAYILD